MNAPTHPRHYQVTSVLAKNADGETVSFEADAVVMCVSVQVREEAGAREGVEGET